MKDLRPVLDEIDNNVGLILTPKERQFILEKLMTAYDEGWADGSERAYDIRTQGGGY